MVGIYSRQSVEKIDSLSIDTQIEKCIQLCTYKGWEYEVYKDSGYSGSNINRPDFERLLADVRSSKINRIVTYRLDRISRNINDFGGLLKEFETYSVDFISVTENFDTSTPMGRAMVMIVMVFAQLERETIAERIKDNAMHRASLGRFTGGPVPMGFTKERITESGKSRPVLKINEEESKIIQTFYDWYLDPGGAVRGNVVKANNLGIKTKSGQAWNCNQMSRILQNAIYVKNDPAVFDYFEHTGININNSKEEFDGNNACMYYRRRKESGKTTKARDITEQYIMVAEHQGIIDGTKWIDVQHKMSGNKSRPPRLGDSLTSILAGLVRCGHCGGSMNIYQMTSKEITYRYFKCRRKESQGNSQCEQKSFRADLLEKIVEDKLYQYCKDNTIIEKALLEIEQEKPKSNELDSQKKSVQKKLSDINKQIEKGISSLFESEGSNLVPYIKKKIAELELQKNTLLKELEDINMKTKDNQAFKGNVQFITQLLSNFKILYETGSLEEKKHLIHSIVSKIEVKNEEVYINFFLMEKGVEKSSDSFIHCLHTHVDMESKYKTIQLSHNNLDSLPQNTFGEKLKYNRLKLKLYQKDIARLISVSEDSYCYWENGRTKPRKKYVELLEKLFKCTL